MRRTLNQYNESQVYLPINQFFAKYNINLFLKSNSTIEFRLPSNQTVRQYLEFVGHHDFVKLQGL